MKVEFCRHIFEREREKNKKLMSNLIKIRPEEAELFHADWGTDMTKRILAYRKFANAPKSAVYDVLMRVLRHEDCSGQGRGRL
jgi:hypothetical protein